MICRLIDGITLGAWQLACPAAPAAPWAYAAAIAGIAATLLLALRARKRPLPLRILTAALFALGFILLAVATDVRSFAALGETGRLAPGTSLPAPSAVFPRYVEPEEAAAS